MNMKLNALLLVLALFLFTGCIDTPDKEGWTNKQKKEFLELLKNDKYASICNQKGLYDTIKQNHNSKLMSRMLVHYANNLANGCIDLASFNALQEKRNSIDFSSKYISYLEVVNVKRMMMQLRAGLGIEAILKPYVPEYVQFGALIHAYHALLVDPTTPKTLLYKIRLNIERLKLMKPKLGDTYTLVNIPEFKVRIIENNHTSLSMRVIVGKKNKQTPIFAAKLAYIVLNPTWNVPDSIARHEIIPKALKNPEYLSKHRLVVRKNYDIESPAIQFDPEKAKEYVGGEGDVPFKFIEKSSRRNALGRVKFIFPNGNSVYMHDTPTKWLFKKKVRAYSHGCVRLAEPMKMLHFLAKNYSTTTKKEIDTWYKSLKTHMVAITKYLPVHTAYLTTYIDEDGLVHTYPDIYKYDTLQKLNF